MLNSVRSPTEAALALAKEHPEMGKIRAARELRSRGIRMSPSTVHAIWTKHGLATTYQRLKRRAARGGRGGAKLSQSQRALLRRATISRRISARRDANGDSGSHPRREELLTAAARVFSAKGYDRATLREICEDAGIRAGSMYHHFGSKEDLYVSVHADGFRQLHEAVNRALDGNSDPWDRLEAAVTAHLSELVGRSDVVAVTVSSLFHRENTRLQRRLTKERAAYETRIRRLIDALPLPPEVDKSLLRLTLLGAVNWTRIWFRPGKKDPCEIARHLVRVVLKQGLD